jgi:hypothetical protein
MKAYAFVTALNANKGDGNNSWAVVADAYPTFAAADTTPPASPAYDPANNATDVAVTMTPTLTFSEALCGDAVGTAMAASPAGIIKVFEGTSNSGTALTEGTDFTVAYDSANYKFTVTFAADLKNSQAYYIELQADKVYDAEGNAISSAEGVSFTTAAGTTAPGVSLGSPSLTGEKYYYADAVVTGDNIRTILISFSENITSGDKINLPTSSGFTVSSTSNDYTKRINLDAGTSASAVQAYLRGVGFAIAGGRRRRASLSRRRASRQTPFIT